MKGRDKNEKSTEIKIKNRSTANRRKSCGAPGWRVGGAKTPSSLPYVLETLTPLG